MTRDEKRLRMALGKVQCELWWNSLSPRQKKIIDNMYDAWARGEDYDHPELLEIYS